MLIYCICTQYLVGAPFALITASIRRGSLWHCWGGMKPRFLWQWPSAHLHFWSLVSHFPLDNTCSGQTQVCWVCWPVKHTNTNLTNFKKLVRWRKHEVLQNVLINGCSDVGFQKTQWTNNSRWHCTQIITDCGNLTLDFKQLVLWASPPFLQTLGPWFPNEIQNLLSSEKRTLDHWAIVQFFFSLDQGICWDSDVSQNHHN